MAFSIFLGGTHQQLLRFGQKKHTSTICTIWAKEHTSYAIRQIVFDSVNNNRYCQQQQNKI